MKQPDLGRKIAELRKDSGLTQEELVEKCDLSVRTLQRIESGEVIPRSYTLKRILDALGCSYHDLNGTTAGSYGKRGFSGLKWFRQCYQYFLDLVNLKTNTMKKVSILTAVALVICVICMVVCTESNAQKPAKVKQIIEENNKDFFRWFNVRKIDSLMTLYRDDACVIAVACGKQNIKDYYTIQASLYKFQQLDMISLSICDTIAVEKGSWLIEFPNGENYIGEYMTEWRYSKNKWLIVNDISTIKPQ